MLKHIAAAALLLALGSASAFAADTPVDPAAPAARSDGAAVGTESSKTTTNGSDQPMASDCTAGWKSSMKWTEADFNKYCAK